MPDRRALAKITFWTHSARKSSQEHASGLRARASSCELANFPKKLKKLNTQELATARKSTQKFKNLRARMSSHELARARKIVRALASSCVFHFLKFFGKFASSQTRCELLRALASYCVLNVSKMVSSLAPSYRAPAMQADL